MWGTIGKVAAIGVSTVVAVGTAATVAQYNFRRNFSIFESERNKRRRQKRVSSKSLPEKIRYAWGKGEPKLLKPSEERERFRASMARAKERGKQAVKEMKRRDRRNKLARLRRAKLKRAA